MSDGKPAEILIIRRGGGDDGMVAKGGAWKIAYADFVTAMMAFFLVMWLINSANEVTKSRVASYFNPIKMTDASPARKGLKENIDSQSQNALSEIGAGKATKESGEGKVEGKLSKIQNVSDEKLLMNPYDFLDELADNAVISDVKEDTKLESTEVGDPFNPRSFEKAREPKQGPAEERVDGKTGAKSASKSPDAAKVSPVPSEKEELLRGTSTVESEVDVTDKYREIAEKLKQKIVEKIEDFKGKIDLNVRVEETPEGLLIVLEDGSGKSMFVVGSAQPNPALVVIVSDVGKLLAETEGALIIRGHTDGRQFRNRKYDNWQLSTDRAHIASYMLVRGGLPESRIKRIEGYGSSDPVEPGEFMLDANRRVEFLLQK